MLCKVEEKFLQYMSCFCLKPPLKYDKMYEQTSMPALNVMHLRAFSHKCVEDSTVSGPDCPTITQGNPERMMRVLESLKRSHYTICFLF